MDTIEIHLTLVSTKRTLLILMIGSFITITIAFYFSILFDFQFIIMLGIFLLGGLSIYFLLKYFSRFTDKVIVNNDYIQVGDRLQIYWDDVKSYQYSNTGLLVGFVFRTINETYRITGLTKGIEGEKFKLITERIYEILTNRESNPTKNKILVYNFYTSKEGKRSAYVTLVILVAAILITLYSLIIAKKIKPGMIFDLGILCWISFILIRRIYFFRK
jgi:hypothetical protein